MPVKLAMRAGRGLQRDRIHAGDLDELLAQHLQDAQRALAHALRLIRMRLGQSHQPRHVLIHARVVLHGARAQRIHAVVHGIVPRRDARVVADDLDLAYFRHIAQVFTRVIAEQLGRINLRHVERRQLVALLAGRRFLEDQAFVLADVGGRFGDLLVQVHSATSFATASIEAFAVVSVQHHSEALFSSG
jgi:hypothetical protein